MWWLLFVGGVVAFLVACVLYLELRGHRGGKYDRTTDPFTTHQALHQQSDSLRNQSGMT
jgi:hypothetical protein